MYNLLFTDGVRNGWVGTVVLVVSTNLYGFEVPVFLT